MNKNIITEKEIKKAAELTYFDFLKGHASKEEDFRCILYFHLRKFKERKKSKDIILLNPKKFKKFPDIIIIHEPGAISYIEIKQFINFKNSSKKKLDEDMKKIEMYKIKDANFKMGYLIHFYRNFQKWKDLKKYDNKSIRNLYFPNEKHASKIKSYLKNSKSNNHKRIINELSLYLKDKGILINQEELKSKIDEIIQLDKNRNYYGWIPVNSYIERDEFLVGYKKIIKTLVKYTTSGKKPIRFYYDILNLSSSEIRKLKRDFKTEKNNLVDLIIILKLNDLIRSEFLS